MKFKGTVQSLRSTGEGVAFTITNVRQLGAAEWREYGGEIEFKTTEAGAKAFQIGRSVTITIKVKP